MKGMSHFSEKSSQNYSIYEVQNLALKILRWLTISYFYDFILSIYLITLSHKARISLPQNSEHCEEWGKGS